MKTPRSNRFNILIRRPCQDDRSGFNGVVVSVRYGYVEADENDADGRPLFVSLVMPTIYDPQSLNNLGQRGAVRVDVDIPAIARAVGHLRAAWGPLPVQDNSGFCPHLATTPGVLAI